MFIDTLKQNFEINTPIFTEEIIKCFPAISRSQIFRNINTALENQTLIKFSKGVYYLPEIVPWGLSTISSDMVIEKKYRFNNGNYYGVYGSTTLFNLFGLTTQIAAIPTIISNNEYTRKRCVTINECTFILKSPYVLISNKNFAAYTILELFNEWSKYDKLNTYSKQKIIDFVNNNNVTIKEIISLSSSFPPKALNNMIRSGLMNELI